MSDYTPDRWVMLKITYNKIPTYKILAGWGGGYMQGQSWRLNSGITEIKEEDDRYLFNGYSGSIYYCYKNSYGTINLTDGLFAGWKEKIKEEGLPEDTMIMLPEDTNFMEIQYVK